MTSAAWATSRIAVALAPARKYRQFKGRACELFSQDLRVRIAEGSLYAYPDVVVVCGEPEFADEECDVLLKPTVIIEVL